MKNNLSIIMITVFAVTSLTLGSELPQKTATHPNSIKTHRGAAAGRGETSGKIPEQTGSHGDTAASSRQNGGIVTGGVDETKQPQEPEKKEIYRPGRTTEFKIDEIIENGFISRTQKARVIRSGIRRVENESIMILNIDRRDLKSGEYLALGNLAVIGIHTNSETKEQFLVLER